VTLSPLDLWDGLRAIIRVSKVVPCKGMATRYVSEAFGTKIDQRSISGRGVVFLVKGPGWRYTLIASADRGHEIERMSGLHADIDHTFTLARIAA
jgi:hypothetical protein